MTPRTTHEFLVGTSKQFNPALTARAYFRYRNSDHFWEDTNNNARLIYGMPTRPGIPAGLYIPTSPNSCAAARCSGVELRDRGTRQAYTKYYEATVECEWRGRKAYARGSYTWSHYCGQLRPGQHDGRTQRRQHLHRVVQHRRWRRTPAVELQGGHAPRRPPALLQGVRLLHAQLERHRRRLLHRRSPASPGSRPSYEPYVALTTQHERRPTGTRSRPDPAERRRMYQVDLNYIQNIPLTGRYKFQVDRGPVQRVQHADGIQLSCPTCTARCSTRRSRS